jgi:hypothetical protein
MAEEIVGLKVKVDASEATKSLGQVRKEIKQANSDLIAAQKQFGDYSAEAIAAAKKVAQLKDSIQEARETADLFDPGKKFQVFAGALSAVAGGFSAVQGAIGLLGVESEEVEKSILKVQSALALSQGLSTVADSAKDFQRLGAVIKTQVVNAFSTLRGAIIATGIGALAVGVGLLIANFETVKKVVLNFIPGLGKLADFVGNLVQKFTDFVGITSEADRVLEKLSKTNEKANENISARVKLLTAQGGKEKEIYALQKEANANETNALRERLKLTGKLTEEEAKRFRELKVESAVLDATEQKRINERNAQAAKDAAEKQKERDKEQKEKDKIEKDRQEGLNLFRRERELEAKITKTEILGVTAIGKDALVSTQVVAKGVSNAIQVTAAESAEAQQKINQAKFDSEVALAQQSLAIIGSLVDQNSAAGKAIAVTQAIINTYQGATKAIAQGGIFGPVAAAATIAAGLVSVRNILSTKVPSAKGTGSVPNMGGGSMSISSAPISPSAPIQNTVTQLDQGTINQMGSAAGRAYVVESDITNQQEKIVRINRAARLG